jgi:diaminopimelate decarboxylase
MDNKRRYERPTIIRHITGISNKFGHGQRLRSRSEIDGVPVKDLLQRFGSPLFVFSESTIRRSYRRAFQAFSVRYPEVQFAWSYKTNHLDAVCRIYHQEGSWAEVVSEHEYDMARRNGMPGGKIVYNGPYKPEASLRVAAREGAKIHIDHYDELYLLETIAGEMGETLPVGIRVNMDVGIYPSWDRFGFNYENGEALNAARRIKAGGKLTLTGIHSHIGTFVMDPNAYSIETEKLTRFLKQLENELDFDIRYIDVGGGFASANTLHEQYAPGRDANPSLEVYADHICSALLAADLPPDRLPKLVLETGRALVDESGYLLTTVVANKRLPNGVRSLIVDAGMNHLFTACWYRHEVMTTEEKEGLFEETVVYGPLCMNIDVVRPSIRFPDVRAGEPLVIFPVGAYNVTQWMQFIRMRPGVVLIGERGEVDMVRKPEALDHLKDLETVPARFEPSGSAA